MEIDYGQKKEEKMKKYLFGAIAALMLMSCNNATGATGETPPAPAQIQCYSGGVLIYSGSSNDISDDVSPYYYLTFTEEGSGKRTAVSGDCIVVYD